MRHRTWFRMVLKAIGVLLIGFGAPDLIHWVLNYTAWMYYETGWMAGSPNMPDWLSFFLQIAGSVVQIIIGIFLILGAQWLVTKLLPSGDPFCEQCGYDLSGSKSVHCPECGATVPRHGANGQEPASHADPS